ncbi:MAG TPA: hypothetical protein VJI46_02745 [Candidatus Nanoarchaeia archaeon]|nr:hypothetical protein [Candidatus Nanoarchaeia archaeon]
MKGVEYLAYGAKVVVAASIAVPLGVFRYLEEGDPSDNTLEARTDSLLRGIKDTETRERILRNYEEDKRAETLGREIFSEYKPLPGPLQYIVDFFHDIKPEKP